jgi:putative redox protein
MAMDAKITWKSGMKFTGVADSNIEVPLDTTVAHGGEGLGVVPMEMILMGLGGCTSMDVISILAKKRQEVTSFEILLHGDRATEHPKVFTNITIEYVVKGKGLDPEAVERAVELSENKYCPGMAMLRKAVNITTSFRVEEA